MKGVVCLVILCATVHQALSSGWSYHKDGGSAAWTSIADTFCNGTRQSPIDIVTADAVTTDLGLFNLEGYASTNDYMTMSNNGHGFVVSLGADQAKLYNLSGGSLPRVYQAHSFHMHWGADNTKGSEHVLNGRPYAAELHLVHYDTAAYNGLFDALLSAEWDAAAVLGFLIEVGDRENTAFDNFLGYLDNITNYGDSLGAAGSLPSFSLRSFMPFDLSRFWRYNGSLTIPDCHETIVWTVFQDTIKISQAQLDKLRELKGDEKDARNNTISVVDNFRVTNPIFDRTVYLSRPEPADLDDMTTPVAGGYANVISPMGSLFIFSFILALRSAMF